MGEPGSDRDRLVELMARYASVPDTGDWDELPSTVFADSVEWAFESVSGRPAVEMTRAELMDGLRVPFAGFAATHHAITNHRVTVDGDTAHVRAHVRAEHWLRAELAGDGPACWLIVGFYDADALRTADGWRLRRMELTATHQEHAELFAVALAEGRRLEAG